MTAVYKTRPGGSGLRELHRRSTPMSRMLHGAWVICLGIGLLAALQTSPARAPAGSQDGGQPGDRPDRPDDQERTPAAWAGSLPTDAGLARQLQAVQDYAKEEAW